MTTIRTNDGPFTCADVFSTALLSEIYPIKAVIRASDVHNCTFNIGSGEYSTFRDSWKHHGKELIGKHLVHIDVTDIVHKKIGTFASSVDDSTSVLFYIIKSFNDTHRSNETFDSALTVARSILRNIVISEVDIETDRARHAAELTLCFQNRKHPNILIIPSDIDVDINSVDPQRFISVIVKPGESEWSIQGRSGQRIGIADTLGDATVIANNYVRTKRIIRYSLYTACAAITIGAISIAVRRG